MNGKNDSIVAGNDYWVKHEGKWVYVWVFAGDFTHGKREAQYQYHGRSYKTEVKNCYTEYPADARDDPAYEQQSLL